MGKRNLLVDYITLSALLERWKEKEIGGTKLDFDTIAWLIRCDMLRSYGHEGAVERSVAVGEQRPALLGLALVDREKGTERIIFDTKDIESIEQLSTFEGITCPKSRCPWRNAYTADRTDTVTVPMPDTQKRTGAANDARQGNKLAVWKELFPCMVRIYARMEQGRTYTRKEVAELFQGEGVDVSISKAGKITDAGLDYFWKLFTNSGRPLADLSKCGSPDVSAATTTDPLPDDN